MIARCTAVTRFPAEYECTFGGKETAMSQKRNYVGPTSAIVCHRCFAIDLVWVGDIHTAPPRAREWWRKKKKRVQMILGFADARSGK